MNDRIAQLLAKLCPVGPSLGSTHGGGGWNPLEVSTLLVGASPQACMAILAKYTEDPKEERKMIGYLSSLLLSEANRKEIAYDPNTFTGAHQAAKVAYFQYFDGYRCNNCGGRGTVTTTIGPKTCPTCSGDKGGCMSDEFKLRALDPEQTGVNYYNWLPLVSKGEDLLTLWESEGGDHLERKERKARQAA